MASRDIPPIHPGEHLADFMEEMGLTQYALAKALRVDVRRINLIVQGKRSITADTSMRLGVFFGQDEGFWLRLQERYELDMTKETIGQRILQEVTPFAMTNKASFVFAE